MMVIVTLSSILVAYTVSSNPPAQVVVGNTVMGGYIFSSLNNLFGLLIPLVAIFEGYVVYGRDRLSGVLDSILIKPITKQNVLIVRFLACVVSVLIGLGISTTIVDSSLVANGYSAMPPQLFITILLSFLSESSAFVGLVFLVSHLSRSQTILLGVPVALFFTFGILWGDIITSAIIQFAHVYPFSSSEFEFLRDYCLFSYASPVSFVGNAGFLVTGVGPPVIITFQMGQLLLDPRKFGVTLSYVTLAGLIWAVVPILTSWLLSRKYD